MMPRKHHKRNTGYVAVVMLVLASLLVFSVGCEPWTLLGGGTINIIIPLGLGGQPGILNPTGGALFTNANNQTNPPTPAVVDSDITTT